MSFSTLIFFFFPLSFFPLLLFLFLSTNAFLFFCILTINRDFVTTLLQSFELVKSFHAPFEFNAEVSHFNTFLKVEKGQSAPVSKLPVLVQHLADDERLYNAVVFYVFTKHSIALEMLFEESIKLVLSQVISLHAFPLLLCTKF